MGTVDDAIDRLNEIADELGLDDDDERENFIGSAMARKGYTQRSTWAEPDNDGSNKERGDFFASKRRGETRRVPPRGGKEGGGGFTRYAG